MIFARDAVLPCQKFTLVDEVSGQFLLIGCGSWPCAMCGPRKVKEFAACIERMPLTHKYLKFLTITYAGPYIDVREFHRRLGRFFRLLRDRFGHFEFARVDEYGELHLRLHCHAIANLPFISNWRYGRKVFSTLARRAGLGWVKINARPREVAVKYLAPYLNKQRHVARAPYQRFTQCSMGLRKMARRPRPGRGDCCGPPSPWAPKWNVIKKVVDFPRWAAASVRQWLDEFEEHRARAAGCVCADTSNCIRGAVEDSPCTSGVPLSSTSSWTLRNGKGEAVDGPASKTFGVRSLPLPPNCSCGLSASSHAHEIDEVLPLNLKMTGIQEKLDGYAAGLDDAA